MIQMDLDGRLDEFPPENENRCPLWEILCEMECSIVNGLQRAQVDRGKISAQKTAVVKKVANQRVYDVQKDIIARTPINARDGHNEIDALEGLSSNAENMTLQRKRTGEVDSQKFNLFFPV